MTKPHYVHPINFGGFFFMQFMDLLLNPKLYSFLTRINYHGIRATAWHEWVNQDLLPNDWNVGSINQ